MPGNTARPGQVSAIIEPRRIVTGQPGSPLTAVSAETEEMN